MHLDKDLVQTSRVNSQPIIKVDLVDQASSLIQILWTKIDLLKRTEFNQKVQ